jgi:hypothetical protein
LILLGLLLAIIILAMVSVVKVILLGLLLVSVDKVILLGLLLVSVVQDDFNMWWMWLDGE